MLVVIQTASFRRSIQKLHPNQKRDLDLAVKMILRSPASGGEKKGDLRGVRIYKFKMVNQLTLLACLLEPKKQTVTLLAVGSHENFYRDLKRQHPA